MQMPGLQFPAEKLGDTIANQRFMASGLMAPRQENAVPVLAPPGSIINNDWQGVMEVGGQGQAWKVPPGQQVHCHRVILRLRPILLESLRTRVSGEDDGLPQPPSITENVSQVFSMRNIMPCAAFCVSLK
ncbi:hypothetical protein R1flu_017858 [Riccia fluitans]|uniref:Uncharacterized protein n=1 Tax=Riccia fluitans TaxID=41844 RepID=A0ABD1ZFG5_9MARC